MKDLFATILKSLSKNVLVAITLISATVAVGLYYKQQQQHDQRVEFKLDNIDQKINTVDTKLNTVKADQDSFQSGQKIVHLQITTTLDIIKKAQTKSIQQQIEQSNQIFDQLKRKDESFNLINPIWLDSVQKKSLNSIYALENGSEF
jgi:hypothetical protein